MTSTVHKLLECGLSIIPIKMPDKRPTVAWKKYQKRLPKVGELIYKESLGFICGMVSGNVEALDFDIKNILGDKATKQSWEKQLEKAINKACPGLLKKVLKQRTGSQGFHYFYRCEPIGKNQVLARAKNKKPLIETRGEGGYVVIAPTKGYSIEHGSFEKLKTISATERLKLFEVCKSFDECPTTPQSKLNEHIKLNLSQIEELNSYIDALGRQDITSSYQDWMTVMFGISHTFGEAGREAMHRLCHNYPGYSEKACNEKFDGCLKNGTRKQGDVITIASVFNLINAKLPALKIKQLTKENRKRKDDQEEAEYKVWSKEHVYLIPSTVSANKYAHVLVDNNNICYYFESLGYGKPSELLKQKIAEVRSIDKWFDFENEGLLVFDEKWIQKDTDTECYFYFQNGTIRITKNKKEFIPASTRPMIWDSLVQSRDYKHTDAIHEIADLAKMAVVDYEKLKIGIGYLLHRYWFRNATKIVWAVDHKPVSRHDGRRGKDLFTTLVSLCRKWVPVKWKVGHNFWTSSITPDTAIVHFEDVSNRLSVDEEMKKTVTGDLSIELKGANILTRKFSDKPKFSASSQAYPLNYMDASIRGRIWLIEFTDYLQEHPPKKVLLYDDTDLSSFDNWMIQCVQCYLQNIDKLKGTPEITDDQLEEALKASYGNQIINAVKAVQIKIRDQRFILTQEIMEELEIQNGDGKTIIRFKECYERITGKRLVGVQRTMGTERVRLYEER